MVDEAFPYLILQYYYVQKLRVLSTRAKYATALHDMKNNFFIWFFDLVNVSRSDYLLIY